jgi:hypothetical protein
MTHLFFDYLPEIAGTVLVLFFVAGMWAVAVLWSIALDWVDRRFRRMEYDPRFRP